jgi:allantoate deiminase
MDNLSTLAQQILKRCDDLARCTEVDGQVCRTFLSDPMHQVHNRLTAWMEEAGLSVRVDAVGNLIGRYRAAPEGAPTLLIGSHLDTVPNAGRYDGPLGVLLGLALAQLLAGRKLGVGLEVVGFSEEEGVRFRTPFLGSHAMVGSFQPTMLNLVDAQGYTVEQAIRRFGLDPLQIPQAALKGDYLGFLEFHIEQGPVLEAENLSLGLVGQIVGLYRLEVSFTGQAAHAGTTPMNLRRDALSGAAQWMLEVEHLARVTPGLVATVGWVRTAPGAANVIPGQAVLSLDLRHPHDESRGQLWDQLWQRAQQIAAERGLQVEFSVQLDQPAVPMDRGLQDQLAQAFTQRGHLPFTMVSGAGHDAMIMAQCMPAAMVFLHSPGGISHNPLEAVRQQDVEAALAVGVSLIEQLEAARGA